MSHSTTQTRLSELVARFAERRVVVVGDLVADQFVYGEISRVSREAPVPILRHERTQTVPGGAANCAANLPSLVARLRGAGVDCEGVVCEKHLRTTTKVRLLAGHPHGLRQQVIRLDYEGNRTAGDALTSELTARLHDAASEA